MKSFYLQVFIITLFTVLFFFGALETSVYAQAGTIDPSFDHGGILYNYWAPDSSYSSAVRILSDGNILSAGNLFDPASNTYDFVAYKYASDGGLPLQSYIADISNHSNDLANCMLLLKNNDFLVGGTSYINGKPFMSLVRFKADGDIDSGFGKNGRVLVSISSDSTDTLSNIIAVDNSKLLLYGTTTNADTSNLVLVKLNANGSADSTFGKNGVTVFAFKNVTNDVITQNFAAKVVTQSDGKIIAAASAFNYKFDFAAVRFLSNGKVDSSFGTNGQTLISFKHPDNDFATSVAVDRNDKIVIAGYLDYSFNYSTRSDFELTRLSKNGVIDSSFGIYGRVQTDISGQKEDDLAYCVGVQTDGKIVVGGTTLDLYNINASAFIITRYNSNGITDSAFGKNGVNGFYFAEDSKGIVKDFASQPDGKLVVAGRYEAGSQAVTIKPGVYFLLYRLNNDGVLPVYINAFTAAKDLDKIVLNWQSVATNISNYTIEKSINARAGFSAIGSVPAQKNTGVARQYIYNDLNPSTGVNYYRLNFKDEDGSSHYSNIISVYFDNDKALYISPNPVKNIINIKGLDNNTSYRLQLTDAGGHLVYTSDVKNVMSYGINAQTFLKGIYFLNLKTANGYVKTIKLVIE